MPYIVTTTKTGHGVEGAFSQGGTGVLRVCECGMQSDMAEYEGECPYAVSRRAVATLEEARCLAHDMAKPGPRGERHHYQAALLLPKSGGTVGPLPDETVIEVAPRQWYQLAEAVGWHPDADAHRDEAELLATFNAKQAA